MHNKQHGYGSSAVYLKLGFDKVQYNCLCYFLRNLNQFWTGYFGSKGMFFSNVMLNLEDLLSALFLLKMIMLIAR